METQVSKLFKFSKQIRRNNIWCINLQFLISTKLRTIRSERRENNLAHDYVRSIARFISGNLLASGQLNIIKRLRQE